MKLKLIPLLLIILFKMISRKNQRRLHGRHRKMKTNWSRLPEELVTKILLQLPANSVSRVKCTCKLWNDLIADPLFSTLRLNRTIVEDEEIRLMAQSTLTMKLYSVGLKPSKSSSFSIDSLIQVKHRCSKLPITDPLWTQLLGSCHGIFLVSLNDYTSSLRLWNPFTGDVIKIPRIRRTVSKSSRHDQYMYGIGRASNDIDGDYKVVQIRYNFFVLPHKTEAIIYSLREASWRVRKSNADESVLLSSLYAYLWKLNDYCPPYYARGCVYWLGCPLVHNAEQWKILCFDFGIEEFKGIPVPDAQEPRADWARLGVLKGCLSMVYHYNNLDCSECVEIFLMKEDGAWCKQHVIFYPLGKSLGYLKLLCYTKDGKLLVQAQQNRQIFQCDPATGTYKWIWVEHHSPQQLLWTYNMTTYIPSLVPLTSS